MSDEERRDVDQLRVDCEHDPKRLPNTLFLDRWICRKCGMVYEVPFHLLHLGILKPARESSWMLTPADCTPGFTNSLLTQLEQLREDKTELLEELTGMVFQCCSEGNGTLDAQCRGSYESALELLAKHGVVEPMDDHGRMWKYVEKAK